MNRNVTRAVVVGNSTIATAGTVKKGGCSATVKPQTYTLRNERVLEQTLEEIGDFLPYFSFGLSITL